MCPPPAIGTSAPIRSEYQVKFLETNGTGQGAVGELFDLQEHYAVLERQFLNSIGELERQHFQKCRAIFKKRAYIAKCKKNGHSTGEVSPAKAPVPNITLATGAGTAIEVDSSEGTSSSPQGIPYFWLEAMKNHTTIASRLEGGADEQALGYLEDVKVEFLSGRYDTNIGFSLYFDFGENPFFFNATLVKQFFYGEEDGEEEEMRAPGCKIWWKEGMDLTETDSDKPEAKSFFEFFKSRSREDNCTDGTDGEHATKTSSLTCSGAFDSSKDSSEEGPQDDSPLDRDFELGETIKDNLIPHAVDWYTGEACHWKDESDCLSQSRRRRPSRTVRFASTNATRLFDVTAAPTTVVHGSSHGIDDEKAEEEEKSMEA